MTIDDLKRNNLILLECISGSRAYGLDTPSSDTDIKGVFILPKHMFYGLEYIPQISNETNDIVYYELSRYIELLSLNNPNILELLNTPKESVILNHPSLEVIESDIILSKLCKNTFGKFALAQIKKARGLNKKILNPVNKERKSVLSFCYVSYGQGSINLLDFLNINGWKHEDCGLVNIPHMKNIFALFHSHTLEYNGIVKSSLSNDITLSSIPKGEEKKSIMYFNKDGYSKYCKDYKDYWSWVENRNEERYEIEIGKYKAINVVRPNRDYLLSIKRGEFSYEELLEKANSLQRQLDIVFELSDLQLEPDVSYLKNLAFKIRDQLYVDGVGNLHE